MQTLLDCIIFSALVFAPITPILYPVMVVVADSIITALKNWND